MSASMDSEKQEEGSSLGKAQEGEEGKVSSGVPDILSHAAMHNAYYICHNVQVGQWDISNENISK